MTRKNLPTLPLLCVYYDLVEIQTTYFKDTTDFDLWQRSAFQYGVVWAHLIEKETGKVLECQYD